MSVLPVDTSKIPGWGVDRKPERRPGVPMEVAPGPMTTVAPPQQPAHEPVVKSASVERMPPVFGTAVPLRGLSGALRRAAYRVPEHEARHWLLLLLADRVDALEGRLEDLGRARGLALAALGAAGLLGAIGLARKWPRRRKWWMLGG